MKTFLDMKELIITMSINGGEGDEFSFYLDNEKAEQLEKIYREGIRLKRFGISEFWNYIEHNEEDLANNIKHAILEELTTSYIFSDDGFHYDLTNEDVRPDECFPLCDLHFVYLTDEEEITDRYVNCVKTIIYSDNTFDCDFSCTFDIDNE